MWRRLRRTTLGPRKPVIWPEQYALALVTAIVLGGSIAFVAWVFFA